MGYKVTVQPDGVFGGCSEQFGVRFAHLAPRSAHLLCAATVDGAGYPVCASLNNDLSTGFRSESGSDKPLVANGG
jgi:hypothetical protein